MVGKARNPGVRVRKRGRITKPFGNVKSRKGYLRTRQERRDELAEKRSNRRSQ